MKLAIISDIHANWHALQAVWADLQAQRPDSVVCLGDLVGYGAHPNEVVDFIREQAVPTIMGNYDEGVGFDMDDCGCVYRSADDDRRGRESLHWSRLHTRDDNKAYLRGLPGHLRQDFGLLHVLLVHGSPRKMNEYLYEDRPPATFERIAKVAGCDVLLFGHTHLPYQKSVARTLFINAGSVGKPKDGDPRAGYVIVETAPLLRVEFRRVEYAVAEATAAIRATDLPHHFADLLESGGIEPAARALASDSAAKA